MLARHCETQRETRVEPSAHFKTSFVQAGTCVVSAPQTLVPHRHWPAFFPIEVQQIAPEQVAAPELAKSQAQSDEPATLAHPMRVQLHSPAF